MCRNLCLKYIYDNFNFKNVIYIPFDTDLDLFENTSMKKLEEKIIKVINEKNIQALFPYPRQDIMTFWHYVQKVG